MERQFSGITQSGPAGARRRPLAGLLWLAASVALGTVQSVVADADTPYVVVDGKVDRATYLGWRTYNSACYLCHGTDAQGTSVAPDLVARVGNMSPRDFAAAVLTRYRIVLPAGKMSGDDQTDLRAGMLELVVKRERGEMIMPAWEKDPNVKPHVMDLYAYLRARSDGVLGPERPQQMQR